MPQTERISGRTAADYERLAGYLTRNYALGVSAGKRQSASRLLDLLAEEHGWDEHDRDQVLDAAFRKLLG